MNNVLKEKWQEEEKDGKIKLEKTKLQYTKTILNELKKDPEILDQIINNLEITEADFLNRISNNEKANITFYDQTMHVIETKKKNR